MDAISKEQQGYNKKSQPKAGPPLAEKLKVLNGKFKKH